MKKLSLVSLLFGLMLFSFFTVLVFSSVKTERQIAQEHNQQRRESINTMFKVLDDYVNYVSDSGGLSIVFSDDRMKVGPGDGEVNLCRYVEYDPYHKFSVDPVHGFYDSCEYYYSGFSIFRSENGDITIYADYAELGEKLYATKNIPVVDLEIIELRNKL